FVSAADKLFGPITTLRQNGHIAKHIPWAVFRLGKEDWKRVHDVRDILSNTNAIQQAFSAERQPTLWRALPAFEDLQSAWEEKCDDHHFAPYHDAIYDGLVKLKKYYTQFDDKPAFLLSLLLHSYYKLEYITHNWGGAQEQAEEIAAGNPYAKNWQHEAMKAMEAIVSNSINYMMFFCLICSRWRRIGSPPLPPPPHQHRHQLISIPSRCG
ncbi:hypothetical protein JOM56_000102, partial [Amanita muscaria]